jgi:hypothetical protein
MGGSLRLAIYHRTDMEIAPGFTTKDWRRLDFTREEDWLRGIGAFRRRIEARFLDQTRAIVRNARSGFAVLALDSLLVETLQQFVDGNEETPRGRAVSSFAAFLSRPAFRGAFDRRLSELFYTTIRNGILHQAEVKGSSLVRRDGPIIEITPTNDGVIVNPVLFHRRLERAFYDYIDEINERNCPLRPNWLNKMTFIVAVSVG